MQNNLKCPWCLKDELYQNYHDNEWGKPNFDDHKLFEMIILESFQAGLSWHTILKKRENFRIAFDGFDATKVSKYDTSKISSLMQNEGIIRNKLKILAVINNAQCFLKIQKQYGSFANFIWAFVGNKPIINNPKSTTQIPATTLLSDTISKELKKKGFTFFGSTTCYAFMQSIGIINDHLASCPHK